MAREQRLVMIEEELRKIADEKLADEPDGADESPLGTASRSELLNRGLFRELMVAGQLPIADGSATHMVLTAVGHHKISTVDGIQQATGLDSRQVISAGNALERIGAVESEAVEDADSASGATNRYEITDWGEIALDHFGTLSNNQSETA